MNIPEFKNTEHALQFGREHAGNLTMIDYLGGEYNRLQARARALMDAGKESEALYLSSGQVQFVREAREEAERKSKNILNKTGWKNDLIHYMIYFQPDTMHTGIYTGLFIYWKSESKKIFRGP
jgi:hypothetical protein